MGVVPTTFPFLPLPAGDNPYGHPHQETIDRLEAVSAVIYQTEDGDGNVIDGDITIKICSDSFWVNGGGYPVLVGIDRDQQSEMIPKGFMLYQNYPDPFKMETEIGYDLPKASYVTLEVYDILGQKITTLVNQRQPFGSKAVTWDASSFASGIHFYRLQAGDLYGD